MTKSRFNLARFSYKVTVGIFKTLKELGVLGIYITEFAKYHQCNEDMVFRILLRNVSAYGMESYFNFSDYGHYQFKMEKMYGYDFSFRFAYTGQGERFWRFVMEEMKKKKKVITS